MSSVITGFHFLVRGSRVAPAKNKKIAKITVCCCARPQARARRHSDVADVVAVEVAVVRPSAAGQTRPKPFDA